MCCLDWLPAYCVLLTQRLQTTESQLDSWSWVLEVFRIHKKDSVSCRPMMNTVSVGLHHRRWSKLLIRDLHLLSGGHTVFLGKFILADILETEREDCELVQSVHFHSWKDYTEAFLHAYYLSGIVTVQTIWVWVTYRGAVKRGKVRREP